MQKQLLLFVFYVSHLKRRDLDDWLAGTSHFRRSSNDIKTLAFFRWTHQHVVTFSNPLDFVRTWINWWILSLRCSSSNPTESSMQTSCAPCASGLWRAYIDPTCVRREGRRVNSWLSYMISALSPWVQKKTSGVLWWCESSRSQKGSFPVLVIAFFLRG